MTQWLTCLLTGTCAVAFCLCSPAADLQWEKAEGHRHAPLEVPASGRTGFETMPAAAAGVAFTNYLSDTRAAENQIRLIGSGVALGDVDGDGWCDIYLCQLEGPNRLYRNRGNWKFDDITAQAGVACDGQYSTGCVLADVDGDGDLDLLVNSIGGGTRLFVNDANGRFAESRGGGLLKKFSPTSMALADIDGDGDLDLYVANYRTTTIRSTGLTVLNIDGKRVLRPEDRDSYEFTPDGFILEHGEVDALYVNDGKGHFTPLPWTEGAFLDEAGKRLSAPPKDWGLSVMFRDMNRDGAPDIYVCNDFWSPDRIWINDGKGHFRALPNLAMRNTSTFSMGVDFADVNRDGHDDFFILDMLSRDHGRRMRQRALMGQNAADVLEIDARPQVERNTFYFNRGDGTYAEIAQLAGVQASEWSWGVVFLDVDLDGYEDMLITTGHGFDTQDSDSEERIARMGPLPTSKIHTKLLLYPRLHVPNVAFRNRGDLTFEEAGQSWGFDTVGVSHGIAVADLDNDGDLDVVVNHLNQAAGLYRNESIAPRVAVRLRGPKQNRRGIGARITLKDGAMAQSQELMAGGRYLSGDAPMRVFAARKNAGAMALEVVWRDGKRSLIPDVKANHLYEIDEEAASPALLGPPVPPLPRQTLFEDVSDRLGHVHHDEPFDDFARQKLLPWSLSRMGAGVSWADVDQDGKADLLASSGRGGVLAVYRNRGDGTFGRLQMENILGRTHDDQTTVLSWPAPGGSSLLLGYSNYETAGTNGSAVKRYEIWAGGIDLKESLELPGVGAMAVADIDGDGELDLFTGGAALPGRYPWATPSRLYRREGERFQLMAEWAGNPGSIQGHGGAALGIVNGAVFSDLTGDGFPELILASHWSPIRVFRNEHGRFTEMTAQWGLEPYEGFWNGVATGDFDGDGRLDIVASNWGRNTPFQEFLKEDLRLFYGDLAGNGEVALVLAYVAPTRKELVPWRDRNDLAEMLPWVGGRFATAKAYGEANLKEVLGERLEAARQLRVNWPDSTVFLNRGEKFEARSLPIEAQFAPAFATCVGDVDGDGREDIFLSQNFFAVDAESSRYDAGRGIWLRGDGQGSFAAVPGQESGVKVYGEQRGAALADFDEDGRVDLAVSQTGAETKLFRNVGAPPGLRVRLEGPPGNRAGFGAQMRLQMGERLGPVREVQCGSGYRSQASQVQVLGGGAPTGIWVRWPGGRVTSADIVKGAREVVVTNQ